MLSRKVDGGVGEEAGKASSKYDSKQGESLRCEAGCGGGFTMWSRK